MKPLRAIFRSVYTRTLCLLLQLTQGHVHVLSPRSLKGQLGPAGTLRIAAAGTSVNASDKCCGRSEEFHVLGVNYFTECVDLRLWNERIIFVIEPHETYQVYAQSLSRAAAGRPCYVIVKGIGSPKKVTSVLKLVRELSAIPGVTVFLSNDRYVSDLETSSYADGVIGNPDRVISGGKTLMWALSFGFVAGYTRIVLHGFDFGISYAFESQRGEGQMIQPNTWTTDPALRDGVLKEVERLAHLFSERGIALVHAACSGPLSELLPADTTTGTR